MRMITFFPTVASPRPSPFSSEWEPHPKGATFNAELRPYILTIQSEKSLKKVLKKENLDIYPKKGEGSPDEDINELR